VPEGDNIHRHASELGGRLVGHAVTALYARGVSHPALVGQVVTTVEAQGKHLLIGVGDRVRVHVHLGMNGHLRVVPRGALPLATAARASLVIATEEVAAVWTNARTVELLRAAFMHEHPVLAALGPDLLDAGFEVSDAVARARTRPPDTTVGELLLDQRVASGIGNVYKSETLFLERLDPWTPVPQLPDEALAALYGRARALMQANLGPWRRTTTTDLSRGGWGRPGRGRLHVYRRRGRPCHVCGTAIAAAAQGTPPRATYFCPRCQRRAAAEAGARRETRR
jgi:endonuclease-8